LAQVVNARYDPHAPARMMEADFEVLRNTLADAGLKLRAGDDAKDKLTRLRSMYEPYVHSTAQNLMLSLPPWKHAEKMRDNWQAGPWDRAIQAKSLEALGHKATSSSSKPPATSVTEDHF
jgi:hypothetical protein